MYQLFKWACFTTFSPLLCIGWRRSVAPGARCYPNRAQKPGPNDVQKSGMWNKTFSASSTCIPFPPCKLDGSVWLWGADVLQKYMGRLMVITRLGDSTPLKLLSLHWEGHDRDGIRSRETCSLLLFHSGLRRVSLPAQLGFSYSFTKYVSCQQGPTFYNLKYSRNS